MARRSSAPFFVSRPRGQATARGMARPALPRAPKCGIGKGCGGRINFALLSWGFPIPIISALRWAKGNAPLPSRRMKKLRRGCSAIAHNPLSSFILRALTNWR